jgi:hypothetical protein
LELNSRPLEKTIESTILELSVSDYKSKHEENINFISFDEELACFKVNRKQTPAILLLLRALIAIKPTSTSTERVFSVAGSFKTIKRSRLGFKTLNSLIYLRYYYKNSKEYGLD